MHSGINDPGWLLRRCCGRPAGPCFFWERLRFGESEGREASRSIHALAASVCVRVLGVVYELPDCPVRNQEDSSVLFPSRLYRLPPPTYLPSFMCLSVCLYVPVRLFVCLVSLSATLSPAPFYAPRAQHCTTTTTSTFPDTRARKTSSCLPALLATLRRSSAQEARQRRTRTKRRRRLLSLPHPRPRE